MSDDLAKRAVEQPLLRPVKIFQKKSDNAPFVHADGAWGAPGAGNDIHLNFFVEHEPVARSLELPLKEDGNLDANYIVEQDQMEKTHFVLVRDIQAVVVMSLSSAKQVHMILGNFIKIREAQEQRLKNEPAR